MIITGDKTAIHVALLRESTELARQGAWPDPRKAFTRGLIAGLRRSGLLHFCSLALEFDLHLIDAVLDSYVERILCALGQLLRGCGVLRIWIYPLESRRVSLDYHLGGKRAWRVRLNPQTEQMPRLRGVFPLRKAPARMQHFEVVDEHRLAALKLDCETHLWSFAYFDYELHGLSLLL